MFVTPAYAQAAGAGGAGAAMQFLPLILIFAIMYFLLIRPQQKKLKEHKAMVEALRRGDQVITQGSIIGKVAKVKGRSCALTSVLALRIELSLIGAGLGRAADLSSAIDACAATWSAGTTSIPAALRSVTSWAYSALLVPCRSSGAGSFHLE